ncbi:MAG: GAF domain-containing protein [Betaproteobacteria bacterium]|nr:MAG: GAF domain-containing protein [Betaproteobacteria bacterium]
MNTMTTDDLWIRLKKLNAIGIALSKEQGITRLLETILVAAKNITNADGGTIYLMEGEGTERILKFEIIRTDSLHIAMGGTTGEPIPLYPVKLTGEDGKPNNSMVVAYAALHDCTVKIDDAYIVDGFDFSGTKRFDKKNGYRSKSFLTVPMKNHESEIIGVLQLINAQHKLEKSIISFTDADQHLVESLASQAAIALTNRQLINQLENLFESFIKLINTTIDDKSPYTGKHCERVPVLTMMLAEAVNRTTVGPLKDFHMTELDRKELKIAGLLHDCGKISTPVHVVDKATKLQTIFDQIHMIDTRFEVLKRDAEIELLNAKLEARTDIGAQTTAELEQQFQERISKMNEERKFLRECNIGGESMALESQERVRQIGTQYTWRDISGKQVSFLTEDEINNLSIKSGTLTSEERNIINHHIVMTIKMLETLPWPKNLRHVPEYASGHHERMDGKGYPRGLTREQMSVQARVMGIADIFEALTSADRPYKKGKTLTESLHILGKFRLNGHLDPDLFDVFVREKVYLDYARQFLDQEQIDDVIESKIPGYTP